MFIIFVKHEIYMNRLNNNYHFLNKIPNIIIK